MQLHYSGNVLKENVRIQPPIALLFTRTVAQDAEFNGTVLPKDVSTPTLQVFVV